MVLGQGPLQQAVPGSIGVPIPGTDVAVLDDDYNEIADGEIGHFLIASNNPGFFLGYHKDPEKTAEVVHDGCTTPATSLRAMPTAITALPGEATTVSRAGAFYLTL